MLLPDHGKHPQDELKLYSVHSLADGIRIILPVTFPEVTIPQEIKEVWNVEVITLISV